MLTVIHHPLIEVKMDVLRDENTPPIDFRELLEEVTYLMSFEVFKDLQLKDSGETIRTPTGCTMTRRKLANHLCLVPILRAGMGMLDGVKRVVPTAKVGVIGLARDEKTLEPHEYYIKLPEDKEATVVVIDPMLATGGSALHTIKVLKESGFKRIRLMCLIGVKEAADRILKEYPDVDIYLAALDEKLNEKGYILPGLGDAGDRLYGTTN